MALDRHQEIRKDQEIQSVHAKLDELKKSYSVPVILVCNNNCSNFVAQKGKCRITNASVCKGSECSLPQ